MSIPDGLLVPVIPDADQKDIREISRVCRENTEAARRGSLRTPAVGTFTITNLGHLGVDAFTPILNRPESGVLGIGRVVEKPAVVSSASGSRIDIRSKMILSLTVDHRIIDGAPASRFLSRVGDLIENPYLQVC